MDNKIVTGKVRVKQDSSGQAMPPSSTGHDWNAAYEQAQRLLMLERSVEGGRVYPRWVDSECFWYDRTQLGLTEYRVIHAPTGAQKLLVKNLDVAHALTGRIGVEVDAGALILANFNVAAGLDVATFEAFGKHWRLDVASCGVEDIEPSSDRDWLVSPDGRSAAFVRDFNLWVKDLASGVERALTTDGMELFAYACLPMATRATYAQIGARPEAVWSPDSRRLLTIQTDDRHVPELPIMDFAPLGRLRPEVQHSRFSIPEDARATEFRLVSIEVDTGLAVEPDCARQPAVRMNDTPIAAGFVWWDADGSTAYLVHVERGERTARLLAFDVLTGAVRELLREESDTSLELSVNVYTRSLIVPIPGARQVLWYSERSGRGHLYLHSLLDGALIRAVTAGEWQVRDIHHVDLVTREVLFSAAGVNREEDPYICKPCIASLDVDGLKIVSSEPGDHILWRAGEYGLIAPGMLGHDIHSINAVSPDGQWFVETIGQVDRMPRTLLRDRSGELQVVLEEATCTELPEGWRWPQSVSLRAADGTTEVFGLLFQPHGFQTGQSYPLIDYLYGGPQISFVPKSAFTGRDHMGEYLTAAALAALGAFVLIIDGRGTAGREREFRVASYGAAQTASNLEDHMTAIRQLAADDPAIDLTRVGVAGFSGGGYMASIAALRYGDFFKVAVAGGGNYDQALFWHSWGERYHGPWDAESYKQQAAKTYAEGLVGKLLLVHGMLDDGCHPAAVFQLIQAFIEADKDVDVVLMPRASHEMTGYGERRRLDYFVQYLFGEMPPKGMRLTSAGDELRRRLAYNAQLPSA